MSIEFLFLDELDAARRDRRKITIGEMRRRIDVSLDYLVTLARHSRDMGRIAIGPGDWISEGRCRRKGEAIEDVEIVAAPGLRDRLSLLRARFAGASFVTEKQDRAI